MIKPSRAAEMFLAIRLTFEGSSYDGFKYDFKIRDTGGKFAREYEKLARKFVDEKDLKFFLFTLFMKRNIRYVGDVFTDDSKEKYIESLKFMQAFRYKFDSDLSKIVISDLLNGAESLLKKTLRGDINIETASILAEVFDLYLVWDCKYKFDPFMSEYVKKLKIYHKILEYSQVTALTLIDDNFKKES